MAARAHGRSAAQSGPQSAWLPFVANWYPLPVVLLWLAVDVLLWARRLSGVLEQPLPAAGLCLAGIVLAAGSELLRRRCDTLGGMWWVVREGWYVSCGWLSVLAALLSGAAISLPGSSWPGLALLWGCLVAELGYAAFDERRRIGRWEPPRESSAAQLRSELIGGGVGPVNLESAAGDALDHEAIPGHGESLPDDVVQQVIRRQEPDGSEWITGILRVRFEPGQRTAHTHVAFCPPFPAMPACEAEPVSGPDAQLTVGQVLPQGARFDLRLEACSPAADSVVLEFAAHWVPTAK